MKRHATLRMLEAMGRERVPPPEPALVERIAARLRAVSFADGARSRPPRRRRLRIAALAAASVVALALVASLVLPGDPVLVVRAASDTFVTMPDGRTVAASAGLELPEGSVVRTGPQGLLEAGEDALGPRTEAVVTDGRLVRRMPSSPEPAEDAGSAPTARPEPTPATRPTPLPTRVPESRPTPEATLVPVRTPAWERPEVTREPSATPALTRPPSTSEPSRTPITRDRSAQS